MRFFLLAQGPMMLKKALRTGFIEGTLLDAYALERSGRDTSLMLQEAHELGYTFVGAKADAIDAIAITNYVQNLLHVVKQSFVLFMPMTLESLKAVRSVTALGVIPGISYVCTVAQGLAAARAGAHYVLLDDKRLSENGIDVISVVKAMSDAFFMGQLATKILIEGELTADRVGKLAVSGAYGIISVFDVLTQLVYHPITDLSLEMMLMDAKDQH